MIKPCRPVFSSSACKALTQVTEKEGSSCGEESSGVGPAIPIRARVSQPPAQAPGGQLCRFGFQGACAHARRGAARTRSRRAALSARHQIGNKTLIGLRVSCSQSYTRAPARKGVWGCQQSCNPAPLLGPRGTGATYRWAQPPGAAARPGCVHRALSLGRKRNRVDRRRALTRRLFCGERQAARSGRAPSEGAPGESKGESVQLPSQGNPECTPESSRRGTRASQVGSEGPRSQVINYCLGSWVPARAASKAQCPPSRPPAPRGKS